MKISNILKTVLVVSLMLAISGMAFLLVLNAQKGQSQAQGCDADVSIDPPTTSVAASGNFTVDVVIENITDMGGFEFELHYDPNVVHVENIEFGPFPGTSGRSWAPLGPNIDNGTGVSSFGGFSFGSQPGDSGSGVIAVVTLSPQVDCQANPDGDSTTLDLQNVQVIDTGGTPFTICVYDGQVNVECCYWADIDCDGDVDVVDVMLVAAEWGWPQ